MNTATHMVSTTTHTLTENSPTSKRRTSFQLLPHSALARPLAERTLNMVKVSTIMDTAVIRSINTDQRATRRTPSMVKVNTITGMAVIRPINTDRRATRRTPNTARASIITGTVVIRSINTDQRAMRRTLSTVKASGNMDMAATREQITDPRMTDRTPCLPSSTLDCRLPVARTLLPQTMLL